MSNDIYRYQKPGGGPPVFADPLVLSRRLSKLLGGDVAGVVAQTHSDEDGLAEAAYAKLGRAVCTAFDLGEPFDGKTGRGVREKDWVAVLNAFTEWQERFARAPGSTPTCVPATAPASSR